MCDIRHVVAIDGPAGAGKSTAARRAAAVLGFAFLDTGAMYRAATWYALQHGADLDHPEAVAETCRNMSIRFLNAPTGVRVFVGDEDVTEAIRTPEITANIYRLDENPKVREYMVQWQREFARPQPTVAEGRDMGTVVFPRAACKLYLTASLEERARRRAEELAMKGHSMTRAQVLDDIRRRDERSMSRAVAPLRRADDALEVDTTAMSTDAVVNLIVDCARRAAL